MKRNWLLAAAFAVGGYLEFVRPRMLRSGATTEEVERPFPGGEIVPGGKRSATMAVTIDAPPSRVWPWLVQMGYGRGGWYSWDHLDNWGSASVETLHPEWQQIAVGDRLPSMPDDKAWWEVAALEPERFLALRASMGLNGKMFDPAAGRPKFSTDSTWSFELEPLPGERTRLIVSGYWAMEPRWLQPIVSVVFLEPAHWIMQKRQFVNLRRLVTQPPNRKGAKGAEEPEIALAAPQHS